MYVNRCLDYARHDKEKWGCHLDRSGENSRPYSGGKRFLHALRLVEMTRGGWFIYKLALLQYNITQKKADAIAPAFCY